MIELDKLLEYIRKTNPKWIRTLIERLNENYYSAFGLFVAFKSSCANNK